MVCPSCGVAVDWADTVPQVEAGLQNDMSKKEIRKNKSQGKNISAVWSSKSIFGAIAVIACAVVAYAVLVEKRPGVNGVPQQAGKPLPMSTPMQIPPEIQELENSVAANPDDMSLTLQLANSLHDWTFL